MITYAQLGPAGIRARLEEQSKGAPLSREARKLEYTRRLLVMAERFDSLIYERIAQVYSTQEMREELTKFVDAGSNVMLRAVRDLAFVYQRPPTRSLDLRGPVGEALNLRLAKAHEQSRLNARAKAWGRYAFALNVCWVVPGVWSRQRGLTLDYTLVLPHIADRIWSDSPAETDILLWQREGGWMAVDADAYYWLDSRYRLEQTVPHGLGVCPAVEFRVSEPPAGDFWDIGRGHRLLVSSIECGRIGAAMQFVRSSQNRRLITVFGDTKNMDRKQASSPSSAITAQTDNPNNIELKIHDFETGVGMFRDEERWHIEQAVESYGVPIAAVDPNPEGEGEVSMGPQVHAARAAVREDQIEYIRPAELELAHKSHALMARFGHPLSINPELVREHYQAKWGPLSYVDTPMNRIQVWERKLAMGLMSPAQVCQELHPWMTEAQALAFVLRNLEAKAQIDLFYAQHNVGALLLSQGLGRNDPGESLPQMQGRLGGHVAAQAA